MDIYNLIRDSINNNLGLTVESVSEIGSGASGKVYQVVIKEYKKQIAIKISEFPNLLREEYEMLLLLKEKTNSKIPFIYYYEATDYIGILALEFVSGVSGSDKKIKRIADKKHLAESIIDNLLEIQKAKNDKFGLYNNPIYDTWYDYYKEFADEIFNFSKIKYENNELCSIVMKAVELSYRNLNIIFSDTISEPTLIHGDYWVPNFIIDEEKMELVAAIDPFNVMWADSEYELFALNVGIGKKLHLLDVYKSKVNISKYFDVKLEMYALYSELLWCKKGVNVNQKYLKNRAKLLLKKLKEFKLI